MSSDAVLSIPALRAGDKYHVFISYSSGDSIWVSGLIHKLEAEFPDLKICFHERDFVPGKTIIDNMVECIQSSQKTVMVLSPDFVHSRWCLFEANLSMFQDSMVQKSIVPIMLKPCPIPLHLGHLTYLEADDNQFFDKLIQVLLSNNNQLTNSTLIHYQPSFLYHGKNLVTLSAINEDEESWQPGFFSSGSVPDSLKSVLDDSEIYKEAIEIMNDIPSTNSWLRFKGCQVLLAIVLILPFSGFVGGYIIVSLIDSPVSLNMALLLAFTVAIMLLLLSLCGKIGTWQLHQAKLVAETMVKKTSQANVILSKHAVLAGCSARDQVHFVYVSLDQCMETFYITFGQKSPLATDMWEKAILTYSSDYACCLAKKHFPFNCKDPAGHVKDGICFCQYVITQLSITNDKSWQLELLEYLFATTKVLYR